MARRHAARDPHWITTKYPTVRLDGSVIPAGTEAFYYPAGKTTLFGQEANDAAAKFAAERQDEDNYGAGYGV